jgi:hypothetical protein
MEGEGSIAIDMVGDVTKASLLEASIGSSSSDSSREAASDVAEVDIEDTTDPCELARSYDFEASSVIVNCIRQLESQGYFVEGSARELGEETVLEPNVDEVVVFEEFFAAELQMMPLPNISKIFLKFWVQLHQLTPNAIAQMLKYFWVVVSFGGEPSSNGFAKRYELHYQPKKVPVNGFMKFQQFNVINFHGK